MGTIREAQKSQRRERILESAEQMLRAHGPSGLSMRELAESAGVSLVTPYNLFESKRGVLLELFRRSLRPHLPRFARLENLSPLDQLYDFINLLADILSADSPYNRHLLIALAESGSSDHLREHRENSYRWLTRGIRRAVASQQLTGSTPVDIVATNILLAQAGAYQLWAEGSYSDEELRVRYLITLVVSLLGFATDEIRTDLINRLDILESRLATERRHSRKGRASQDNEDQNRQRGLIT